MATPRVFVSSTYYDLKHIRSSLEMFVESFGYDAVLSEKGSIAYTPDQPLDESCYREVKACDVYVLIIGGRYGSEISETRSVVQRTFFERYESVTKMEYEAAVADDVPIYILIERAVYAEYQTFLKNRERTDLNYAHVDSVNVFFFIESILSQPRNNPIQTFDKYLEIEMWLRLQWAGLFREMLKERTGQAQLVDLAAQVRDLSEVTKTLRRYMEEVVSKVAPQREANTLIRSEDARLLEARTTNILQANAFVGYLCALGGLTINEVHKALIQVDTLDEFIKYIEKLPSTTSEMVRRVRVAKRSKIAFRDLNAARILAGKPPFEPSETEFSKIEESAVSALEKRPKRSRVRNRTK